MNDFSNGIYYKWVSFWIFVLIFSSISIEGHGGQAAVVLIFSSLYILFNKKNIKTQKLSQSESSFILLILLFFLIQFLGIIFQPENYKTEGFIKTIKFLDKPSRWLLLIPIYIILRRVKISWAQFSIAISIGVFISLGFAINEVYFLNIERAKGGSNHSIPFAEIMVWADLLLWILMIYAWDKNKRVLSAFLLFASLLAFYGSLLSVSRGAWVAYIFMFLIWLIYLFKKNSVSRKSLKLGPIIVRVIFAVIIFLFVSQTNQYKVIESHTVKNFENIKTYGIDDSLNGRISLYQDSLISIGNYPYGVGTGNFHKIPQTKNPKLRHAHNEILNLGVENGIQAIIVFLALIFYCLIYFYKHLGNKIDIVSMYASLGLMHLSSFLIFGLSQSTFSHHQTLFIFIFFLYFFISQIEVNK